MSGSAVIKGISQRGDSTYLVSIDVANDSGRELVEFVLLEELLESLSIEIGDEIAEELSLIDYNASVTAAYSSACASFAYVQSSIKALYRKLIVKGFSKEVSRDAIDIVRKRGFVDEEDIALRRAEIMIGKLWGRSRILKKLFEEGFPGNVIEYVSESLDNVDFSENCQKAIAKKYQGIPIDRKERDKMYAFLIRLGYSSSDIRRAISQFSEKE